MSEEQKPLGMNVGSASIIMVFAVLCLTIFSVLALVTANQEWQLAQKSAAALTNYYAADSEAEQQYLSIMDLWQKSSDLMELTNKGVSVTTDENGLLLLQYCVPIDERQQISVTLMPDVNHQLLISQWQVTDTQEWTYDDTLPVWNGE